jgi:glycosyltransferase involved in cell wall biosynthesis
MNKQTLEPLVSVVINCFNCERYIEEAIQSVISQTYKNWEIIYWDNCSTDRSLEIVKSINCDKIRSYLAPKHTNLNTARNLAIKQCSGEFISFLDADDMWLENKLEVQVPLFDDPDVAYVFSNFYIFYEYFHLPKLKLAHKKLLPNGYILKELFEWFTVGLLTLVIRKSCIDKIDHPFDPRYDVIGDIVLTRQLSCTYKAASSSLPLAYWRRHRSSMLHTSKYKYFEEMEDWLSSLSPESNFFRDVDVVTSISRIREILSINYKINSKKYIGAAALIRFLPWKQQFKYWVKLFLSSCGLYRT